MIAVALILLVLVAVLVVAIVVSNPQTYELSIFGAVIPANSAGIFITGAVAMAVTILALLMLRMGIRRARARRKQLKALEASDQTAPTETGRPVETSTITSDTKSSTTSVTGDVTESEVAKEKKSALDLQSESSTTTAERKAMLDEADELTREEPPK
jgi:flagellar biosynthesis/type III secretory pathway M-ring protein FliF/YscJ